VDPATSFGVYNPSGGPLTIGGLHIGMTWTQVVQVAGRRPVELQDGGFLIPGPVRLDFEASDETPGEVSPPSGAEPRVNWLCGEEVTQDGRLLLKIALFSEEGPPDVTIADAVWVFGRPTNIPDDTRLYVRNGKEHREKESDRVLGFALGDQMLSLTLNQDRWLGVVLNSISLRAGADSDPIPAAPLFRLLPIRDSLRSAPEADP